MPKLAAISIKHALQSLIKLVIVWENFFDLNSKYRLIYSLEIIEELIIAGENAANRKRIEFVEYQGKAN